MNPATHPFRSALLPFLTTIAVCHGELLVYEPCDYQAHNHEIQGRLEGRNGGKGFAAPWKDTAGSAGYAFIYDSRGNPEDFYGGDWGEGGSWVNFAERQLQYLDACRRLFIIHATPGALQPTVTTIVDVNRKASPR